MEAPSLDTKNTDGLSLLVLPFISLLWADYVALWLCSHVEGEGESSRELIQRFVSGLYTESLFLA